MVLIFENKKVFILHAMVIKQTKTYMTKKEKIDTCIQWKQGKLH